MTVNQIDSFCTLPFKVPSGISHQNRKFWNKQDLEWNFESTQIFNRHAGKQVVYSYMVGFKVCEVMV